MIGSRWLSRKTATCSPGATARDLFHAAEIHNRRAAQAQEMRGRQLSLQQAERLALDVILRSSVKDDVVPRGLRPVDFLDRDINDPFSDADADPARARGQQVAQRRLAAGAGLRAELGAHALQRLAQPGARGRLQEVIERAGVKGAQGMLVVGRDENDGRQLLRPQGVEHVEPVHPRHLDVQEYQVRLVFADGGHRRRAVPAFAGYLYIRLGREQRAETLAPERLVIHQECADLHAVRKGRTTSTVQPFPVRSSTWAFSPCNSRRRARVFVRPIPSLEYFPGPGPLSATVR